MEQFWSALKDFYQNNRDFVHVLIGALAASVLMLIVRLFGKILAGLKKAAIFIGKKIGGRFAYKSFLDTYLDWLIAEYQDLNLTGIIGNGPKPKLEQVFITLGFTSQSEPLFEEKKPNHIGKYRRKISGLHPEKRIGSTTVHNSASRSNVFYKKNEVGNVVRFFDRNWFLLLAISLLLAFGLIIGLFFLVPTQLLQMQFPALFSGGIAGVFIGTAVVFLVWGFFAGIESEGIELECVCKIRKQSKRSNGDHRSKIGSPFLIASGNPTKLF